MELNCWRLWSEQKKLDYPIFIDREQWTYFKKDWLKYLQIEISIYGKISYLCAEPNSCQIIWLDRLGKTLPIHLIFYAEMLNKIPIWSEAEEFENEHSAPLNISMNELSVNLVAIFACKNTVRLSQEYKKIEWFFKVKTFYLLINTMASI